jgi:hypothetical protein
LALLATATAAVYFWRGSNNTKRAWTFGARSL